MKPAREVDKDLARKADCDACQLRARCRPGDAGRKVLRSVHEGARDLARDLSLTDAYLTSRRERKKVEMLQAHPEARPPPPQGTKWRKRRVPPRRHRPEPPQNGQADPDAAAGAGRIDQPRPLVPIHRQRRLLPKADFFNTIRPSQIFRRATALPRSGRSIAFLACLQRKLRGHLMHKRTGERGSCPILPWPHEGTARGLGVELKDVCWC